MDNHFIYYNKKSPLTLLPSSVMFVLCFEDEDDVKRLLAVDTIEEAAE